jgi:hypothetical protein
VIKIATGRRVKLHKENCIVCALYHIILGDRMKEGDVEKASSSRVKEET